MLIVLPALICAFVTNGITQCSSGLDVSGVRREQVGKRAAYRLHFVDLRRAFGNGNVSLYEHLQAVRDTALSLVQTAIHCVKHAGLLRRVFAVVMLRMVLDFTFRGACQRRERDRCGPHAKYQIAAVPIVQIRILITAQSHGSL